MTPLLAAGLLPIGDKLELQLANPDERCLPPSPNDGNNLWSHFPSPSPRSGRSPTAVHPDFDPRKPPELPLPPLPSPEQSRQGQRRLFDGGESVRLRGNGAAIPEPQDFGIGLGISNLSGISTLPGRSVLSDAATISTWRPTRPTCSPSVGSSNSASPATNVSTFKHAENDYPALTESNLRIRQSSYERGIRLYSPTIRNDSTSSLAAFQEIVACANEAGAEESEDDDSLRSLRGESLGILRRPLSSLSQGLTVPSARSSMSLLTAELWRPGSFQSHDAETCSSYRFSSPSRYSYADFDDDETPSSSDEEAFDLSMDVQTACNSPIIESSSVMSSQEAQSDAIRNHAADDNGAQTLLYEPAQSEIDSPHSCSSYGMFSARTESSSTSTSATSPCPSLHDPSAEECDLTALTSSVAALSLAGVAQSPTLDMDKSLPDTPISVDLSMRRTKKALKPLFLQSRLPAAMRSSQGLMKPKGTLPALRLGNTPQPDDSKHVRHESEDLDSPTPTAATFYIPPLEKQAELTEGISTDKVKSATRKFGSLLFRNKLRSVTSSPTLRSAEQLAEKQSLRPIEQYFSLRAVDAGRRRSALPVPRSLGSRVKVSAPP